MKYEHDAARVCAAIRTLAEKPDNLRNLECYLSGCFAIWLEKFANTPGRIAAELCSFAEMEF